MDEVELKFFDIDFEEMEKKILGCGGKFEYETEFNDISFINTNNNEYSTYDSSKKLLRIRKSDKGIKICYKDPARDSMATVREELEVGVRDFKKTTEILERLGFSKHVYYEKKRKRYSLKNCNLEFDNIKDVIKYMEIEASNIEDLNSVCKLLNIDMSTGKKGTIIEIRPDLKSVI